MPADHLIPDTDPGRPAAQAVERAVLAVLAGTPADQAAIAAKMRLDDLIDAVRSYRAAGLEALTAQADSRDWHQVHIEFADRDSAEAALVRLGPLLRRAKANRILTAWWFTRKSPWWRFRLRTGPAAGTDPEAWLGRVLDHLASRDLIVSRRMGVIYEPEALAFGGPEAMPAAHRLFHEDSRGILDFLERHKATVPSDRMIGRREMSVMLCSALLRAAGQEWNEQADIWHRVEALRPLPPGAPMDRLRAMAPGMRHLMTVDVGPSSRLLAADGPLAFAANWTNAFDVAGRSLQTLAYEGALDRGIRDVLALHIIFSWNRIGLPSSTQSVLARAAREVVITS
ncbi:thiopeptide-type bacteriocin biosynthesis protein [Embleya sp. NPDC020630]|uniref:thiopeptide-type bacteriocin biosynthesis protein n=1 Tax=Embleya sp. NPDC020630 TaxID=3363979 RepID=UPI0037B6EDE6